MQNLPVSKLPFSEEKTQEKFEQLQARLQTLWKSIETFNDDEQTIVVIPSMNSDRIYEGSEMQSYEERLLFLLLLLRQPHAHLIYITGQPIHRSIIEYYLNLVPGLIPSQARPRLHLISPMDSSSRPLSLKLLERPHLLEKIRALIPDPNRAHISPYNPTIWERDLAVRLGIPMFGADPKFARFGTKSGCRKLFREADVSHPLGFEDLKTEDEVVQALIKLKRERSAILRAVVKLNEGVSGKGNAEVDLRGLKALFDDPTEFYRVVKERVREMDFADKTMTYEKYFAKFKERGGIVEEKISGDEFQSPSAQLRITPLGTVEQLSTHDQLLHSANKQTFVGCKFPAHRNYAATIMRDAKKVGEKLAKEGVIGRFAIDFVTLRQGDEWKAYAIEINLRKGGTTHPFLTLQFLTDGKYHADSGTYLTKRGSEKYFVAGDAITSPLYRAFTPDDLFDIVARHDLHFNQSTQTGIVFHSISSLGDQGKLGLTAVSDSPAEAQSLYEKIIAILNAEARMALNLPLNYKI